MLRYLLAGESHGPALVGILEGFPAGLKIPPARVNEELARRLEGHGRGLRASTIENDEVEFLAGFWSGRTLGSPIALVIANRDFELRKGKRAQSWRVPRPGHADLAGMIRYGYDDCAPVAERASARSTAALTAAGACAKELLRVFGITVLSHVVAIGGERYDGREPTLARLRRIRRGSPVRCLDGAATRRMTAAIDAAQAGGTTVGGVFEVIAFGVPAGLGSYVHGDRRLDAALVGDLMAIPAVKAAEVGDGIAVSERTGLDAHDEILPAESGSRGAGEGTGDLRRLRRATNRAGGLEGGVTNGEPVRLRGYVKPIASQRQRLSSVDLRTGRSARAAYVRSDVCIVPAAGVIGEAVIAWRLADAMVSWLGGERLDVMQRRFDESQESR